MSVRHFVSMHMNTGEKNSGRISCQRPNNVINDLVGLFANCECFLLLFRTLTPEHNCAYILIALIVLCSAYLLYSIDNPRTAQTSTCAFHADKVSPTSFGVASSSSRLGFSGNHHPKRIRLPINEHSWSQHRTLLAAACVAKMKQAKVLFQVSRVACTQAYFLRLVCWLLSSKKAPFSALLGYDYASL